MLPCRSRLWLPACCVPLLLGAAGLRAQVSDPKAIRVVQAAVQAELEANRNDHATWMYRDHDNQPGKDAVFQVVETPQGELKRMIELNGQAVTGAAEQAETDRILEFVHSDRKQETARKEGAKDDEDATLLLQLMPQEFLWSVDGETAEATTLNFHPNPKFDPPNQKAKVFAKMQGQMIVSKKGSRIRTLRGQLSEDVSLYLVAHMKKGGTFDAEHREIAPGHWQIETLHVHIGGHALLLSVGSQEDEQKSDWKPSPAKTLAEAARILGAGR